MYVFFVSTARGQAAIVLGARWVGPAVLGMRSCAARIAWCAHAAVVRARPSQASGSYSAGAGRAMLSAAKVSDVVCKHPVGSTFSLMLCVFSDLIDYVDEPLLDHYILILAYA